MNSLHVLYLLVERLHHPLQRRDLLRLRPRLRVRVLGLTENGLGANLERFVTIVSVSNFRCIKNGTIDLKMLSVFAAHLVPLMLLLQFGELILAFN